MRFLSQAYIILYWTRRQRFAGFSLSSWLLLGLVLLFLITLSGNGPLPLALIFLGLALLLAIAYAVAARTGYKHFVNTSDYPLDPAFAPPHYEHRVPLRATGIFAVKSREDYVLERRAEYWRVPLGHHIFMVQQQPGHFLYQIIEPENIRAIEPGFLLFGREPRRALALRYRVSWGPEFVYEPRYYYMGEEDQPSVAEVERTVYFTFDHEADLHAVWKSLGLARDEEP
jgi:hypothetical protein